MARPSHSARNASRRSSHQGCRRNSREVVRHRSENWPNSRKGQGLMMQSRFRLLRLHPPATCSRNSCSCNSSEPSAQTATGQKIGPPPAQKLPDCQSPPPAEPSGTLTSSAEGSDLTHASGKSAPNSPASAASFPAWARKRTPSPDPRLCDRVIEHAVDFSMHQTLEKLL